MSISVIIINYNALDLTNYTINLLIGKLRKR